MSGDLTRAQLFFKGLLPERISSSDKYKEFKNPFGLNLLDYDLVDEDLQSITNLIIQTDLLNSLSIRLSDTLTDPQILSKLLRKISFKKQFTTVGFYIKNLSEEPLGIFIDFIGKLQNSVTSLTLRIKYKEKSKEEETIEKILESLLKNENSGLQNLSLNECRLSSENGMNLLDKFLVKNKKILQNISISHRPMFLESFNANISKIKEAKICNCQISWISHLPLEKLNLSYNNISQDGLKNLVKLLSDKKCFLEKLNLSNNFLGDDGSIILSEGISKNKSLISLNLSSNNILNRGIIEIAKSLQSDKGNKTISKLNFSHNGIEDSGLSGFINILKDEVDDRFDKINFSYNNLTDKSIIEYGEFLNKHYTINKISLTNKITQENASNFFISCKNMSQLKSVIINSPDLNENCVQPLKEVLINNRGIENIQIINNIQNLGPNGFTLICPGIEHNTKILSVTITQCDIKDEGAIALANALFKNMDISEIILEDNSIGEKGTKAISEKLLGKTSLRTLDLGHNLINATGAFHIGQGLAHAQGIQFLLLGYNDIGDEGCEFIEKGLETNNSLVELNLQNNNITTKGINAISRPLKEKERFMEIILTNNKISEIDSDFYELFDWVKTIKVSDNPLSPSGIIRLFQGPEHNRLFKGLKFKINEAENEDFHFRLLNENIKKIDLSMNRFVNVSLMKHILSMKNLSQLNLQYNGITDDILIQMINFIKESGTPLKNLILKNNKIGPEGSVSLCELLKDNKFLNILDLSSNNLKTEGIKNICNALIGNNNNLEQLLIDNNKCNDYCCDSLFNMLSNNKKLFVISLIGNFFTNKGVDKILSTLRKNNTLKQISIGDNKIDSKAFVNLPNYIKFNKSLTILEIKSARFDDESLEKLSQAVGQNNSLIALNLRDNSLSYEGIAKFGLYTNKCNLLNEIFVQSNKPQREEQPSLKSCNSHIIFTK